MALTIQNFLAFPKINDKLKPKKTLRCANLYKNLWAL